MGLFNFHFHVSDREVLENQKIIISLLKSIKMNQDELLALLQNEDAELATIAAGVTTLLGEIATAGTNVPQNVQDAANKLKTDLDALNVQVSGG